MKKRYRLDWRYDPVEAELSNLIGEGECRITVPAEELDKVPEGDPLLIVVKPAPTHQHMSVILQRDKRILAALVEAERLLKSGMSLRAKIYRLTLLIHALVQGGRVP
jgi:hypothetical protein